MKETNHIQFPEKKINLDEFLQHPEKNQRELKEDLLILFDFLFKKPELWERKIN